MSLLNPPQTQSSKKPGGLLLCPTALLLWAPSAHDSVKMNQVGLNTPNIFANLVSFGSARLVLLDVLEGLVVCKGETE